MTLAGFIMMGWTAALIVVSWQCFKDPPWEGFSVMKFGRSFLLATLAAILIFELKNSGFVTETNPGIIILTIIALERGAGEIYKGFFKKRHDEYREVFNHYHLGLHKLWEKRLFGLGLALGLTLLFYIYFLLPGFLAAVTDNKLMAGMVLGVIGGLSVAIGGAVKDITFEKFNPVKFMRSPIAGLTGGLILVHFARTTSLLIFASIGFERVFVEWYKTFYKQRIRGIFENKKAAYPEWFTKRSIFIWTYLIGAGIMLTALIVI